jgi:methylated-DNA-[protein]-cysteine S-methyltransferase
MESTTSPQTPTMTCYYTTRKSPVGSLTLVATDKGLAAILWEDDNPKRVPLQALVENKMHPVLVAAQRELDEYFAGERRSFSVALAPVGTVFQNQVWRMLAEIPFGETRSYGEIAKSMGNPRAVRAVGAANGRNPLSIIVPCHRVIGASGKLTGFAGGLERKKFLLTLERARMPSQRSGSHPDVHSQASPNSIPSQGEAASCER